MHGGMPGEKAKNFKGTMKTLLTYVSPFKWKVILVIVFALASTLFSIVSPTLLGRATDEIVKAFTTGMGLEKTNFLQIIMLLLGLYCLSFLFSFGQSFMMAGVAQKITYNLRQEMSEKLDRLPLTYFDGRTHGEILSRVTNDIETVNQSLTQSITQLITSMISLVGILVMMLVISPWMTIFTLLILSLSALAIRLITGASQKQFKNQQKYLGQVNGHVEEMYTGHVIIKTFNREESSIETFEELNNKLCESAWKSQFLSGLMMPITGFIGNLAYVFVCVGGGYAALHGRLSIGNIQAFLQYIRSFQQPIAQVAQVANVLQSTAAAAERVFEFLSETEEVPDCTESLDTGEITDAEDSSNPDCSSAISDVPHANQPTGSGPGRACCPDIEGEVRFENITFGYDPEKPIIKNFSFTARPGQKVAIVGPTGGGKTTLVKLMLRFYELQEGRILIDGKDIKDYRRRELRRLFGMVLQDTWLESDTIMANIRYGKMGLLTREELKKEGEITRFIPEEDVYSAAKSAHIDHFIKTQPGGYSMVINEGASNISQGQKQLITIARAFLADSPILILDEATSSVDTRTESQIQKAMEALMQGRTSFIIAHRLSTIREADLILVIREGNIVEQGTHDELLAAGGFYAELYNSQF